MSPDRATAKQMCEKFWTLPQGLGLQRLALLADLCLPLMRAAFAEGCHSRTPFIRERV